MTVELPMDLLLALGFIAAMIFAIIFVVALLEHHLPRVANGLGFIVLGAPLAIVIASAIGWLLMTAGADTHIVLWVCSATVVVSALLIGQAIERRKK